MQDTDLLADLNTGMLPFAKLLGMTFTAAAPDLVMAEVVVRDDLCIRPAVLHGGAIVALADTLGATAHPARNVSDRPARVLASIDHVAGEPNTVMVPVEADRA
jgi:acyl-coenzyme A thioesterase PaaI-like protein